MAQTVASSIPDPQRPGWYRPVIISAEARTVISVSFHTPIEAWQFGDEIIRTEAEIRAAKAPPLSQDGPNP
jgi:hypothetical protein